MRIFKLDPSSVTLPEWPSEMTRTWEYLGRKAFMLSSKFELGTTILNLIPEVEQLIDERKWKILKDRSRSLAFSRALTHVWTTDVIRRNVSLAPDTLSAVLASHRDPFPRPLVFGLLRLHLTAFSHLRNVTFGVLADGIRDGVNAISTNPKRRANAISAVAKSPEKFLSPDGPLVAAKEIVQQDVDVNAWLAAQGLGGLQDSTYVQAVRYAVLLERIATANPNDESSVALLQGITTDEVIYAPWHSGKYFGHEVLQALIERPTRQPGEFWVNAIIGIAGDPRIEHSDSWREWWRGMDQRLIKKTKKWLAERDLNLFLAAIESFAHEVGDTAQIRQFRSRHLFLRGLLEHDLVRETRVILGRNVRTALKHEIKEFGMSPAQYRSQHNTSVIAMDCGSFQLIEGTHSFALRLFAGPPLSVLTDHTKTIFTLDDFTKAIPAEHQAKITTDHWNFEEVKHRGLWQWKALRFIVERMNVKLDLEKMMSPSDYHKLWSSYGLPIPGSRSLS